MNSTETTVSTAATNAITEELGGEHPIRNYLAMMLGRMTAENLRPTGDYDVQDKKELFKPQCIVTAVKLPSGSIEVAVNHDHIPEKIRYILSAYDSNMRLSHSPADGAIEMVEVFIV